MYNYPFYASGVRQSLELSSSALPDAPVVDDISAATPQSVRTWGAARLRAVARGAYHLADRVDPACA